MRAPEEEAGPIPAVACQDLALWRRQVALERQMLQGSAARFRQVGTRASEAGSALQRSFRLGRELSEPGLSEPPGGACVIPPRPWTLEQPGGYWTAYGPRLCFPSRIAPGLFERREVFVPAINHLQAVPWHVNGRVLAVAAEAWRRDSGIAGLPRQTAPPAAEVPPRAETDREAARTWLRGEAGAARREAERQAAVREAAGVLTSAADLADCPRLYFPHALAVFFGLGPVATGLQPLGSDLARGLLEFAEGRAITQGTAEGAGNGGDGWLCLHLAACFGIDGLDHDARLAWVFAREEQFHRIAADPFADLAWAEAPRPWCALAAVFAFVDFLDEGYGHASCLPVSPGLSPVWENGYNPRAEMVATIADAAQAEGMALSGFTREPCVTHAADAWRAVGIWEEAQAAAKAGELAEMRVGADWTLYRMAPEAWVGPPPPPPWPIKWCSWPPRNGWPHDLIIAPRTQPGSKGLKPRPSRIT